MSVTQSDPWPVHVPVMPAEVLRLLDPQPGQIVVDATVGGAGHALLIARRLFPTPDAPSHLIGLDQDPAMLELARSRLAAYPVTLVHRNFEDLSAVLQELQTGPADAILADLGFSSDQLANPLRGLSFQAEGPLDMRLDATRGLPASALVQRLHERELADLFWRYGEERHSRRIARKIVAVRQKLPILTTGQLAELIRDCVPRGKSGIDPATRVFQALRIAVNDELGALERLLEQLPACLKPGGRALTISFHSLEDRLVKRAFRNRDVYEELTRKPLTASDDETASNPRARSAKLRAARLLVK
jgi:16S rRNA (cytosine1402-N4)-methyltransferase